MGTLVLGSVLATPQSMFLTLAVMELKIRVSSWISAARVGGGGLYVTTVLAV